MLSLFSFLFIVIAMFAVFAMQLFGGHYNNFNDGKPRSNFDTFTQAWLTIFQVSSGDQWMNIVWEAMRLQWVRQSDFCSFMLDTELTAGAKRLCSDSIPLETKICVRGYASLLMVQIDIFGPLQCTGQGIKTPI